MKNPFSNPSDTFNPKILDYLSNDEHVKVTIERTKWNTISQRWETISVDVQEYDIKTSDTVFLIVTNKYRYLQ